MLGLEPSMVHPVLAQPGDQVAVDSGAVGAIRLVLERWPGNVLQPVHQPFLNQHGMTGLAHRAGVTLLFELAHGLRHGVVRLFVVLPRGLSLDVTAIRTAVVFHANGDATVPTSVVLAVVDRRGTVGFTSALALCHSHYTDPFGVRRLV